MEFRIRFKLINFLQLNESGSWTLLTEISLWYNDTFVGSTEQDPKDDGSVVGNAL